MLVSLLQFFACLSLMVLVHEFGHFITAKIFGVRVDKFYIFFNPWFSLFKFKPKNSDTTYGIGWVPLGGYVKLNGMIDESFDTEGLKEEPKEYEFRSKPAWQRLIIMAAGVVMNFIMALVIYSAMLYTWGDSYLPLRNVTDGLEFSYSAENAGFKKGDIILSVDGDSDVALNEEGFRKIIESKNVTVLRGSDTLNITIPENFMQNIMTEGRGFAGCRLPFVAQEIIPGSAAESAGMSADDRILALDSVPVYMSDCIKKFKDKANTNIIATVLRGSDTISLTLKPSIDGKIGVYMKNAADLYELTHIEYGILESVPAGITKAVDKLKGYVSDMKYVFTPEGVSNVGGFGTIFMLFPNTFDPHIFWSLTAFLSIVLAFMNILPIPALDGGHIMFVLYEIVTRKKPSEDVLLKAQTFGMVLLIILTILVNMNDCSRLF